MALSVDLPRDNPNIFKYKHLALVIWSQKKCIFLILTIAYIKKQGYTNHT